MAARQPRSPRDHTGRKQDQLNAEQQAEQERRASEIAMVSAAQAQSRNDDVIDLVGDGGPVVLNPAEAASASAMRAEHGRTLPLGATKQPGMPGVSVNVAGTMTDSAQPGWSKKTNDTGGSALAAPTIGAVTTSTTGGSIGAGVATSYKVTAFHANGETLPSSAAGVTTGAGTTNSTVVNWSKVVGATGYRIYGRTSGSWGLLAEVGDVNAYTDPGTPAPGAAPPGANTTGSLTTGTETPFPVVGGTIADQKVRPTVDVMNASRVGLAGGGPDPEAPRVWLLGDPQRPLNPGGVVEVPGQPVHRQMPEGVQRTVGDVMTVEQRPVKTIRLNTTLENVTIGVGTDYSFVEGQQYRVPAHVADYLEELGYVWH